MENRADKPLLRGSYPAMTSSTTIYVLGLGSIGLFAAHSLAVSPEQPNVTLLLHRTGLVDDFRNAGNQITLRTNSGKIIRHGGYNVEVFEKDKWIRLPTHGFDKTAPAEEEVIEHLVLAVKNIYTVAALKPLKHRLRRQSTILFLQNGSGMMEAVNQELFPDPNTRPNYIVGVISHGVNTNAPFDITHTGLGFTSLGPVPRAAGNVVVASSEDKDKGRDRQGVLLTAFSSVPWFNAKSYDFTEILQLQLEKLTVNAVCNPNAALADAPNSCLLEIPETLRQLTDEISTVALRLPELQQIPGAQQRFSFVSLNGKVNGVIEKTVGTTGSMCCDLRARKKTEVRLINGYWSKRGKEVGVRTPYNDEMVRRIEEREAANGSL